MRMAKIGREFRQASLDIDAIAIPAEERVHGHSMAEIMQAWTSAVASTSQADLVR